MVSISLICDQYLFNIRSVFLQQYWSRWCDVVWLVFRTAPSSPPASPLFLMRPLPFILHPRRNIWTNVTNRKKHALICCFNLFFSSSTFRWEWFPFLDFHYCLSSLVLMLCWKCRFWIPEKFSFKLETSEFEILQLFIIFLRPTSPKIRLCLVNVCLGTALVLR